MNPCLRPKECLVNNRFVIIYHGKPRVIEDCSASSLNSSVQKTESPKPQSTDILAASCKGGVAYHCPKSKLACVRQMYVYGTSASPASAELPRKERRARRTDVETAEVSQKQRQQRAPPRHTNRWPRQKTESATNAHTAGTWKIESWERRWDGAPTQESAGPRHKERRAPTQSARAPREERWAPALWASTQRRSAGPRHRAPGADTKSAGPRQTW